MDQIELSKITKSLQDLSNSVRSAFTLVTAVIALLILLFGVYAFTCFIEEWTKWKERSKEKGKVVEKQNRKKRRTSQSSKSSKSSKASSKKREGSKSSSSKSSKTLKSSSKYAKKFEKLLKKKAETKSKETTAANSSKKEIKSGNAPPPGPPPKKDDKTHVSFVNAKENSTLTAPNYQKIEARWPKSAPLTTAATATSTQGKPADSDVSRRSDVSTSSKQFHDSKCPGTDSFGASVSSFSSFSSTASSSRQKYGPEDFFAPPSDQALTKGTYLTSNDLKTLSSNAYGSATKVKTPNDKSGKMNNFPVGPLKLSSQDYIIYAPHEVPSPFKTDNAQTAIEFSKSSPLRTPPRNQTVVSIPSSPMATTMVSIQSTPPATSPTQNSLSAQSPALASTPPATLATQNSSSLQSPAGTTATTEEKK